MSTILVNHREAIAKLSRRHSVQRLISFVSAIQDDSWPRESDVDLLVEFAPVGRSVETHAFLIYLMSHRENLAPWQTSY